MSVEAVLDTNVLLYALSKDPADREKAERARKLMREVDFGISIQVMQEFYHAARRKARLCISGKDAEKLLTALLRRPWVATGPDLFASARRLAEKYEIGYWDAAVIAAAAELGAPVLYSEDLNHGQNYGGVKVIDPFHASSSSSK